MFDDLRNSDQPFFQGAKNWKTPRRDLKSPEVRSA